MAEAESVSVKQRAGDGAKDESTSTGVDEVEQKLPGRKVSWAKLYRVDSLNLEAARVSRNASHLSKVNWMTTLSLAFQSVGIVYGDIGTSPLYVFASTFPSGDIDNTKDIIGVLSIIIYTIALIPLAKYAFIVLKANDNGDGGTFALYSLICRHAKVSFIPNHQPEDMELSNYTLETSSNQWKRAHTVRKKFENSKLAKLVLFLITIMGTSMTIGDGVLTPSISVLSAVGGIKSLGQDAVVGISVAILVALFCVQRFGTDKVGFSFAPMILLWFSVIGGTGLYNLIKHDIGVLRALNPKYIVDFFKRNGKQGWKALGGTFLSITGSEAMFADLGHFNVDAIRLSFCTIAFPALVSAYCGQAAFLMKFPGEVGDTFYASIPDPLYWPTFVVAVGASIIASQAMVSATFSIISQSLSLGCFPRVKVVHTSAKHGGQVYIPEVNYLLMLGCVIVIASFRTTTKIGNAYGIAVATVMTITTFMVTLIMLMIWKTSIWWIALFVVVFGTVELFYLSAILDKFVDGGFLPLLFGLVLMTIMGVWQYVQRKRYTYELKNEVSNEYIKQLASNPDINRIPGLGLLYSELVQGIPPIFTHFISHIPSIHSVLVFVSIKRIPISRVDLEERFLFRQVEPREYRMFRCVVRYGYNDITEEPKEFEIQLVEKLKEFIRQECYMLEAAGATGAQRNVETASTASITLSSSALPLNVSQRSTGSSNRITPAADADDAPNSERPSCRLSHSSAGARCSSRIVSAPVQGAEEEVKFVQKALERGVMYLLGEAEVVAEPKSSSILKKLVVNYAYSFLRKNFRQGEESLAIPKSSLLKVGMTYEI